MVSQRVECDSTTEHGYTYPFSNLTGSSLFGNFLWNTGSEGWPQVDPHSSHQQGPWGQPVPLAVHLHLSSWADGLPSEQAAGSCAVSVSAWTCYGSGTKARDASNHLVSSSSKPDLRNLSHSSWVTQRSRARRFILRRYWSFFASSTW